MCIPSGTVVVASQSFVAHTGGLPTTTLYTASASSTYRVSVYTDSATAAGLIAFKITSHDDYGAVSFPFQVDTSGNRNPEFTLVIHLAASQSIAVQDNGTTDNTTSYNTYIIVEKLADA